MKTRYVLDVVNLSIKIQKCVVVAGKNLMELVTKHQVIIHLGQKYLSSKCQEIRTNARRVLESSEREKVCQYCHNHEFDAILEVHHLKGILEFDEDTLIKEINNENNLVWLCPNHHIMLEKGLISLE